LNNHYYKFQEEIMQTKNTHSRIYTFGIVILLITWLFGFSIMNLSTVHAQEATTATPQPTAPNPSPTVVPAGDECPTHTILVTLSAEQIHFCAPTDLPSNVVEDSSSDPDMAYAQFNQVEGFGVINIKAITPGYTTGIGRPVYNAGELDEYRRNVWELESSQGDRNVTTGPSGLFWYEAIPSIQIDAQLDTSEGVVNVRSIEWYVEHNNRLWSITVTWDTHLENNNEWIAAVNSFAIEQSSDPSLSDNAVDLGAELLESRALNPSVNGGVPIDLGTPAWWSGTCNDGNYYPYTDAHSSLLGSSWHGVPSCGPRPMHVTTPDHPVYFFDGAHGELEFECVELVMRFLYQEWGIEPWPGNGNEIMDGYPEDSMTFYPNGTQSILPGDILTENGSVANPSGHTAVITAVNLDANGTGTITILEQNLSASGSRSLHVTNWNVDPDAAASGQTIQGWLRVLSNQAHSDFLYAHGTSTLWQIDPYLENSGVASRVSYQITDIAFVGKTLYGISFSQFFSIDPRTGVRTFIGNIGYSNVNALTSSLDGTLYAGTTTGALLRINKSNGAGTFLGWYGPGYYSSGDLAMRYDGTMFASVIRSGYANDWLVRVNTSTGQVTPVGDMGEDGVFGIDFKDGNLYGLTSSGYLIYIDTVTGGSTRLQDTSLGTTFGGASTVGPIELSIGGVLKNTYDAPFQQSTRVSFPGLDGGPVKISTADDLRFIAAERMIYKVRGINTSYSEMMALPASQLDTTYWLPWYNNVGLDTQLRFGNVSDSEATVHVYIGGNEMQGSPFTLAPGASTRKSFAVDSGPVKIESNVPIVAAERMIYKVLGIQTSYSEMMALPASQLDTAYWLPWYNNVGLDTQLRFGNVSDSEATVHVYIGGNEVQGSPFTLAPGASTRKSFASDDGPVQIESDVPIVAAERMIYKVFGIPTSYSEMMVLPASQLDTAYWLPWYNNVGLDTQLRIGNVSDSTATVYVLIGGNEVQGSPFTLAPGASLRESFVSVDNGPVLIVSDKPIVAAERMIYKVFGIPTSYSEMMALPNGQLDTTYWLPWYNNVGLDTQIRFGVP
jgi:hypothetical protein